MARKLFRPGDLALCLLCCSLVLCFFVPLLALKGSFIWRTLSLTVAMFLVLNYLLMISWTVFSATRLAIRLAFCSLILGAGYGSIRLGAWLNGIDQNGGAIVPVTSSITSSGVKVFISVQTEPQTALFEFASFMKLFLLVTVVAFVTLSALQAQSKVNLLGPSATFRNTNRVIWLVLLAGIMLYALYSLHRATAAANEGAIAVSILVGQVIVGAVLLVGVPALALAQCSTLKRRLLASAALVLLVFSVPLGLGFYDLMFGLGFPWPTYASFFAASLILLPFFLGFAVAVHLGGYRFETFKPKPAIAKSDDAVIELTLAHVPTFTPWSFVPVCYFSAFLLGLYLFSSNFDLRTFRISENRKFANARLFSKLNNLGTPEEGFSGNQDQTGSVTHFVMAGNYAEARSVGRSLRHANKLQHWEFLANDEADPPLRFNDVAAIMETDNVKTIQFSNVTFDESFRTSAFDTQPNGIDLKFFHTKNTDCFFEATKHRANLGSVRLFATDLTGSGAETLAEHRRLSSVLIENEKLDAAQFVSLARLEGKPIQLRSHPGRVDDGISSPSGNLVVLDKTINSDVFLNELFDANNVDTLVLEHTDMTDALAERLASMENLDHLKIMGGTFDVNSLRGFSRNANLRFLELTHLPLTDSLVISDVTKLSQLKLLNLSSTNITTDCIKPLLSARRTSRLTLDIRDTKVSAYGIYQCERSLGSPYVKHDFDNEAVPDWIPRLRKEFDGRIKVVVTIISAEIEKDRYGNIVGATVRERIPVNDENLDLFLRVSRLRWLDLSKTSFPTGSPSPNPYGLSNGRLGSLDELKSLKHLERLILPRIDEETFAKLTELTQLREINLDARERSDETLQKLAQMQNLERIHLHPQGITRTLIDQLQSLKKLKEIVIDPEVAYMTEAEVADDVTMLEEFLPDVEITVVPDYEIIK